MRKTICFVLALILTAGCLSGIRFSSVADSRLPFADVAEDAWYYHAVDVCYNDGILAGESKTKFCPNATVKREMVAQVIYRLAGGTPVKYTKRFTDVKKGKWYTSPILWDAKAGLVKGVTKTRFGLGEETSREQLISFLYRLAGQPAAAGDSSAYADFKNVSSYAKDAMLWAVTNNITFLNMVDGRLCLLPQSPCTRAELALILMRYTHREERSRYVFPEVSKTPSVLYGEVTINGVKLPRAYGVSANRALMRADDVTRVWPGSSVSTRLTGDSRYECTVTVNGTSLVYYLGTNGAMYDGKAWYIPCRDFPIKFGYDEYYVSTENHVFYTPLPNPAAVPNGRRVPVLMYHAVGEPFSGGITELFVTQRNMEAQLQYMARNGYTAITFEDLQKLSSYRKPVILTFDDGYRDNYTVLFPLLKKYKMKATIFIFPNNIGKNRNFLTWDMVREMQKSGLVSFQSHTMSHRDLNTLSEADQEYELRESKRVIAENTGRTPFVICYPSGKYNTTTLKHANRYYRYGLKMNGNLYTTGTSRFLIPRYYVSRYTSLSSFAAMIAH